MPLWREIQRKNFSKIEDISSFLQLTPEKRERLLTKSSFVLNLPLRIAEKIEKNSLEDPLFLQFVPLKEEALDTEGFTLDPVGDEKACASSKLLQKYEGRALLLTSSACVMHCRYCFRQNFPYETDIPHFDKEIELLARDSSIKELILSGGDPLSLSDERLKLLFEQIESIPHIQRIRLHTRFPIGIPERITPEFLALLKKSSKQFFFVLHVNHPKELDADIFSALKEIQHLGIPILTQSVLLHKVNDAIETLTELMLLLVDHGMIPYYLHALDRVKGSAHFEVDEEKGKELIALLQKKLPGYAVPKFVREISGELSKTTLI